MGRYRRKILEDCGKIARLIEDLVTDYRVHTAQGPRRGSLYLCPMTRVLMLNKGDPSPSHCYKILLCFDCQLDLSPSTNCLAKLLRCLPITPQQSAKPHPPDPPL